MHRKDLFQPSFCSISSRRLWMPLAGSLWHNSTDGATLIKWEQSQDKYLHSIIHLKHFTDLLHLLADLGLLVELESWAVRVRATGDSTVHDVISLNGRPCLSDIWLCGCLDAQLLEQLGVPEVLRSDWNWNYKFSWTLEYDFHRKVLKNSREIE